MEYHVYINIISVKLKNTHVLILLHTILVELKVR